MKNLIWRASTAAFAVALAGAAACGSSSGCGQGTNLNSNSADTPSASVQCGYGTYLPSGGTQCIPVPHNGANSNNSSGAGTQQTSAPKSNVIAQ